MSLQVGLDCKIVEKLQQNGEYLGTRRPGFVHKGAGPKVVDQLEGQTHSQLDLACKDRQST